MLTEGHTLNLWGMGKEMELDWGPKILIYPQCFSHYIIKRTQI